MALDHDRVVDLHQLRGAVVGVAVVQAHGRAHPVLAALGAPAAAGRPDRADEEPRAARVEPVDAAHDQVGVVAGGDAAGHGRG